MQKKYKHTLHKNIMVNQKGEYMNYIDLPNVPKNNVGCVIIDYRTPKGIIKALKKYNIEVIFTQRADFLYDAINGHADIILHHIGNNKIIIAPEAYDYFKEKLYSAECIKGGSTLSCSYPKDIAYNIARIGNIAMHNLKYTDKNIYEHYEQMGVKLVNIKQGYSKCNICVVSENSVITSDINIAKTADNYNVDVLLIKNDNEIRLAGFEYGFIGGCSGLISEDKLAFAGNIKRHKEYEKIEEFCNKHGARTVSLSDGSLFDIGSIIPIKEYRFT